MIKVHVLKRMTGENEHSKSRHFFNELHCQGEQRNRVVAEREHKVKERFSF